jgi:hypothetical protein
VSHPQAYFESLEPRAASPSLDAAALSALGALYTGEDGFRVDAVEGLGMVASRTTDGFTHMVVGPFDGLLGIELYNAPHWRDSGDELEELIALEPAPPGLEPAGALLDAVLSGESVAFSEPDEERRAALIAFVCFALPRAEGERLTFATFTSHPDDLRLAATTPEHATIDPFAPATGRYAQVAAELARRGTLLEVTHRLDVPDAVALAVGAGATDLITPDELPRTLELITAMVAAGDVATAARAAAAIPDGTDHAPVEPARDEPVIVASDEAPVSLRELEASIDRPDESWMTLDELEASLEDAVSLRELEESLRKDEES